MMRIATILALVLALAGSAGADTLGYTQTSTGNMGTANIITGQAWTASSSGDLNKWRFNFNTNTQAVGVTCALYLSSDRSLVACSEEVVVPTSSNGWFETTPLSPYTINSGTRYIISVWAAGTASDEIIHYLSSTGTGDSAQLDLSRTYAAETCPTPNQNDFRYNDRRLSLYIVYGESATNSRARKFKLLEEHR